MRATIKFLITVLFLTSTSDVTKPASASEETYRRFDEMVQNEHFRAKMLELQQVISSNPKDSNAYRVRGLSYEEVGQYQKAIYDCNFAIGLDPEDFKAYLCRGLSFWRLGQVFTF